MRTRINQLRGGCSSRITRLARPSRRTTPNTQPFWPLTTDPSALKTEISRHQHTKAKRIWKMWKPSLMPGTISGSHSKSSNIFNSSSSLGPSFCCCVGRLFFLLLLLSRPSAQGPVRSAGNAADLEIISGEGWVRLSVVGTPLIILFQLKPILCADRDFLVGLGRSRKEKNLPVDKVRGINVRRGKREDKQDGHRQIWEENERVEEGLTRVWAYVCRF